MHNPEAAEAARAAVRGTVSTVKHFFPEMSPSERAEVLAYFKYAAHYAGRA